MTRTSILRLVHTRAWLFSRVTLPPLSPPPPPSPSSWNFATKLTTTFARSPPARILLFRDIQLLDIALSKLYPSFPSGYIPFSVEHEDVGNFFHNEIFELVLLFVSNRFILVNAQPLFIPSSFLGEETGHPVNLDAVSHGAREKERERV